MFLAIATLPLLLVSILTFTNYKNSLETNCFSQLRDLAIYRADSIETYFGGLKPHIEISQGFYNIKKNFPVLIRFADDTNNPEFVAAKNMLDAQLQQMQSVSDLSDIMLVNPQGRVVYANRPGHYSKDMSNGVDAEQKAFNEGKSRIYYSDIYFDKIEDNRFEMLLAAPATDFNGVFIGVIAFEVDMTPFYKLIQDTTGLGETGEVLVARKIGNQAEFLNPLRHDPNAALKRRVSLGEESGRPVQEAIQGRTGFGQSIDYRGKKVVAAWRYIPSLDWGLVAKIDTKEAFADVTNLRNLAAVLLVIVIFLSSITAFSIAHSISEPIKQLSEGAAIVGSGNLDYKIGTIHKDEIGQLSRTFDKMTQDLKHTLASRDELNREIIERKQAQEELVRSNKDLEQFAYVASHDLQEPLRAVSGFVELLRRNLEKALDAKTNEYMNFAIDGAKRMQSLINGLLEYSRVGTQGKEPQKVNSKEAMDEALARLQASIQESGAKITADDLPTVYFDDLQLTRLFQNLIGNAIKFRSDHIPQIHVSAVRQDACWRFAVRDNGIGIEQQYAERIFMIFQRLHTRKAYPGTGIGLSICKKIVERHGGRIWVETAQEHGSTFYFTVPDIKEA